MFTSAEVVKAIEDEVDKSFPVDDDRYGIACEALGDFGAKGVRVYYATEDNVLKGVMSIVMPFDAFNLTHVGTLYINHLATLHHKSGAGKWLVAKAVVLAKEYNAPVMTHARAKSISFYQHIGFNRVPDSNQMFYHRHLSYGGPDWAGKPDGIIIDPSKHNSQT